LIVERGFGEYFVHRTGHSITHELHGAGTNLDALETIDERPLIPASSFSIEPGIYLPGEFGIRSEIDVVIDESSAVHVTSNPAQSQILPLFDQDVMAEEGMLLQREEAG
jgi:Xaa-Pro aminopeptidase